MSESCDRYKIMFYTGFYCCLRSWKKTCLILITLFVCPPNVSFSIHLALCSPPVRFHQLYKRSVHTITDCGSKQCLIEELWNLTMKYHFSLQNMGATYGGLTQGMLCMILSVEIILIFDSAVYP